MEIRSPGEIILDEVTRELVTDIHVLAGQIDQRRPLPDEVVQSIQKQLLGERVYNSNAIEGSTLTLRETRTILETGGTMDVGKKREATEAINLGEAIAAVQAFVDAKESWADRDKLLFVHQILLKNWKDHAAGRIRTERVILTGAKYQPPRPEKISGLLEEFFLHLQTAVGTDPVVVASWAHWCIARIHPFEDGNGRMARLWQDMILFGNKLTASVIRQQDRSDYYGSLAAADGGNFNLLIQLVAQSLSRTLQVYVNAQREVDELKDWARAVVGETNARVDDKRRVEYLRWSRQMERVRDAFERCGTQITDASDGTIEVQVQGFDVVDQPTWETLRSGGRASKPSFFRVHLRQGEARTNYCFYFGRHWSVEADRELAGIGPSTSLLISHQATEPETAVGLEAVVDSPIRLRELLVVDDRLCRKLVGVESMTEFYQQDVDPVQVAREFLQEALVSGLT